VLEVRKEEGREARRLEIRRRILNGSGKMSWILKVGQGLERKREYVNHVLRQVQSLEVLETLKVPSRIEVAHPVSAEIERPMISYTN
jgi:hypothetical protein